MHSAKDLFSPLAVVSAQRLLTDLVTTNTDVKLAVLTSTDGFEVAAHPNLPTGERIAAMSSSLQALSEAIVREAGLNNSRNVIIESDNGTIVVLGIPDITPRLSLAVVASNSEMLGRLLWATRNCSTALSQCLKT